MENEQSSIHDFDMNLICEVHLGLERQGPGSPEMTVKVLSFLDNPDEISRVADLGCGTGGQTMILAQHLAGTITGTAFRNAVALVQNHRSAVCEGG